MAYHYERILVKKLVRTSRSAIEEQIVIIWSRKASWALWLLYTQTQKSRKRPLTHPHKNIPTPAPWTLVGPALPG